MKELYERWPEDLIEGWKKGEELSDLAERGDYIVVCGMGGSAAAGDFIAMLSQLRGASDIIVVKDFGPRIKLLGNIVLVGVSYSGNTVETVKCVSALSRRASTVVTLSSGGLLRELSVENKWRYIEIPKGHMPRTAFAFMTGALAGIVKTRIGVKASDVKEAAIELANPEGFWSTIKKSVIEVVEGAARLGERSPRRIVAIDVCGEVEALGVRAKNELSENAKLHVKLQVFPEAAHNDIVAFQAYREIPVLIMKPSGGPCRSVLEAVEQLYSDYGVDYVTVSVDTSSAGRAFSSSIAILKGIGLASVEIAEKLGLDPGNTEIISRYKKYLKMRGEPAQG